MTETKSPGAALSGMRKIIDHVCPVCNETFRGITKAKFCSNRCRQKDKYQRSKAKASGS